MAFKMGGRNRAPMSEINVTPLVDVMLVLLIIFMVTAPMLQEGVSVELPAVKAQALTKRQQVEHIILSVSGQGQIFMNEAAVKMDDLATKVTAAKKADPAKQVYLRADKTVPYGIVVKIMAELKNAGIADLGMITTPDEKADSKK